jgi:hypothetical protein
MATAKRRINHTNRKRIGQEAVDIRLLETLPGTPPRATAELKLEGMGFPDSAVVAIEAYRSSSLMRFDCGTVGNLKVPELMVLDEIDAGGNIQFRVKVVDPETMVGRLLGAAARIRPKSKDDNEQGRRSLLPVRFDDLGAEIWRVSGDDDEAPALVLNMKASGLETRILHDPMVRGLVMPAAFRVVLERLTTSSAPDDDDEEDWKREWHRFCVEELEVEGSPWEGDREEKTKWIDEAVSAFASRAQFLDRIRTAAEGAKA